jgi:hypothetical protein
VEPWSKDKVWCENLSVERYFNFAVLMRFGDFEVSISRLKLEVLRKFKFAGVFIQVAIHDLLGFSFSDCKEILGTK